MQNLSTSSSEGSAAGVSRRRLLVAIGIALVFIAGELGARIIEPGFGHNGDWPSNETFVKHEQQIALEGADTVFAGSSFVAFGIDTRIATERSGKLHYNAGLSAAQLPTTDVWLRDFVVPTVAPRRLVLGIGHLELNEGGSGNARRFLEAPAIAQKLEPSNLRRVEEAVQEVSTLFKYRRQIRDIRDLGRAVVQREFPEFWGANGERQDDFSDVRVLESGARRSSDPAPEQLTLLRDLVEWLQEEGIDVVLVLMPTAEGALEEVDGDEGAAAKLTELARSTGASFVDGRGLAEAPELFFDGAHLNPTGQDVFTEALLAVLPES